MLKKLLEREKELHILLNLMNPPDDIDSQYSELFANPLYQSLDKHLNLGYHVSAHDSIIEYFSEKKVLNHYKSTIKLDNITLVKDRREAGYLQKPVFRFVSKESLRPLTSSLVLTFLIDSDNKEIGFYILKENRRKVFVAKYEELSFEKGTEILYEKKEKSSLTP